MTVELSWVIRHTSRLPGGVAFPTVSLDPALKLCGGTAAPGGVPHSAQLDAHSCHLAPRAVNSPLILAGV